MNSSNNSRVMLSDVFEGMRSWHLCLFMAWEETKQKYRRSLLGPFWITINSAVFMLAMGPLYGTLMKQPIANYFQYFAVGYVVWNFIASYLNDSCGIFISAEGYIKQIKLPYTFYLFKALAKNSIIFAHNFIIILIVLVFFPPDNLAYVLFAPLGGVLLVGNLFWMSVLLSIISIRFRDIPQILSNILQLLFFLTPIMWYSTMVAESRSSILVNFNPAYYMLEVVRGPLLGEPPNMLAFKVAGLMLFIGFFISGAIFSKYRSKISYWV
ncbi:ABC transporter permease [Polynucleobacter sp. UB-Tiil-W10]|uniref:ABC transporter permease n=1 Tax=Polynucleobacter sp. UB-Tiil-W10 TaxID=1855648 RepID=UPI001C0DFB24|nr:ABC transporter permease [Polynucleobacter sp. UB-Tiil-W10]MBU3540836.1 ABC transporter permease [Polynucleobacter sp. UB-Tiil-W10]